MKSHTLHPLHVARAAVVALTLVTTTSGCTPYVAAQRQLVDQAQRGIALTAQHQQMLHDELARHQAAQRVALDNAFDDDVRARKPPLTADWIIDHRKGYALAMTGLHKRQADLALAQSNGQANLTATRLALDRLSALLDAQSKLFEPFSSPTVTEQP